MIYYAKYGTQTVISFPMIKAASNDFAGSGDWTPATGDTKVSKDQGNVANTSNNPAATGGTGSKLWNLTITATELQAAEVVIQIVDSATKAVEDQCLIIYTYGNASAKFADDLSATVFARSIGTESYSADGAVPTFAQALFELLSAAFEKSLSGTTMTYKKRDGSTTAMIGTVDNASTPTSITRTT